MDNSSVTSKASTADQCGHTKEDKIFSLKISEGLVMKYIH